MGWRIVALALLALGLAADVLAGEPPRASEVREAFFEGKDLGARRAALASLRAHPNRSALLLQWFDDAKADPQAAVLLARDLLEAGGERAWGGLEWRLREKRGAAIRTGVLRAALDVPALGRDRLRRAVEASPDDLVSSLLRLAPASADEAPSPAVGRMGALFVLHDLLLAPPSPDGWAVAVRAAAGFDRSEEERVAPLLDAVVAVLPEPDANTIAASPLLLAAAMRRGSEVGTLLAISKGAPAEAAQALERIERMRDPRSIPTLIGALRGLGPGALRWRVYAGLLELSGARIPDDAEQWRSWWEAHRAEVEGGTLPSRRRTVEATVARGVAYLLGSQASDGSFRYGRVTGLGKDLASAGRMHERGTTALAVFALRGAGVGAREPAIERAVRFLLDRTPAKGVRILGGGTYEVALEAMALRAVDPVAHREEIESRAQLLVSGQHPRFHGWTYFPVERTSSTRGLNQIDLSNTQYAVLGLREAKGAGFVAPEETWRGVLDLVRRAEIGESGKWSYLMGTDEQQRPGMSAIAAGCVVIARSLLEPGIDRDRVLEEAHVQRALRDMASLYGDAGAYRHVDLYTMYSVERVGALFGIASFDGVRWYETARDALLHRQNGDGSWGEEAEQWMTTWGKSVDTCYALMILRKVTTPVFRGGLDVPSDPSEPIAEAPPPPEEPASDVEDEGSDDSPPAAPEGRVDPASAYAKIARAVARRSASLLRDAPTPAARLAAANAIRRWDPWNPAAALWAGVRWDPETGWTEDPLLQAALPDPATEPWPAIDAARRAVVTEVLEESRRPGSESVAPALRAWAYEHGRDAMDPEALALRDREADRWDSETVARLRAAAARRVAAAPVEETNAVERALGVDLVHVRASVGWFDLPRAWGDPAATVDAFAAMRGLLADALGVASHELPTWWRPVRHVVSGRPGRTDLTPRQEEEMLGSTCRALRQYDAADADALRRALARALVEDEIGPLLGLDTSSVRRRMERLAHVLGPVLAGEDPAPAAAPKAKVSLDDLEAAFEADRPAPDADAIAHAVLRRWLFEHRSAGVDAVRSLVRGRSIEEIAAAWPGGSRAFLQASLGRSR